MYADRLLGDVPADVWAVWDELRLELNVGQYLDLLGTARGDRDRGAARRIARYKSGKYTIERPLHVGAALAGRLADLARARCRPTATRWARRSSSATTCSGAFGDPARTGKPVGQDLREGKPTPLLAVAVERTAGGGTAGRRGVLDRVGEADLDDGEVAAMQQVLVDSGALAEIEDLIDSLAGRAIDADRGGRHRPRGPRRAGRPGPLRGLPRRLTASQDSTALVAGATVMPWR